MDGFIVFVMTFAWEAIICLLILLGVVCIAFGIAEGNEDIMDDLYDDDWRY